MKQTLLWFEFRSIWGVKIYSYIFANETDFVANTPVLMYLSVCLLSQKSLQVNGTIFTYSVLAWIIFLRFSFQLTLVLVLNTLKKYMYIAYFNRFRIDLSFFQVVKTLSKWKPVHGVCEQLGASVLQSLIIKSALGAQEWEGEEQQCSS